MKIALIVVHEVQEIIGLQAELQSRGHEAVILSLADLKPSDFTDGQLKEQLSEFDLVYYRSGLTAAGGAVLSDVLKECSERLVNPVTYKHPLGSNKLYQAILALKTSVQIPPTFMGRNVPFQKPANEFGLPFIVKAAEGIQGNKVFLVDNEEIYRRCLEDISGDIVIQKFIPNDGDYRVFMLGGEVYKVFKRVAQNSDFKNNMSLGAKGEAVNDPELLKQLGAIATTIVEKMDIEIGGVDIIKSSTNGELYFLEVNINPGWRGLDATLGTDTSKAVADYLERRNISLTIPSL